MEPHVALEIFGYIGTGAILLSFALTDVKWMRIVNMIGSFISFIYASLSGNMPVVVLNVSLVLINSVQLMRLSKKKRESENPVNSDGDGAYNNEVIKKEEHI